MQVKPNLDSRWERKVGSGKCSKSLCALSTAASTSVSKTVRREFESLRACQFRGCRIMVVPNVANVLFVGSIPIVRSNFGSFA